MAATSKELLDFSERPRKSSLLESLLVCGNKSSVQRHESERRVDAGDEKRKPLTTAVPTSQVLGKVKDFLGVMAKANEKLELDAQEHPHANYDIEALNGNEEEYIEMDLLLGVAELHNAEAVAAAEAAVGNIQPNITFSGSTCSSSDDSDDESDGDYSSICHSDDEHKKPDPDKENLLGKNKPNKRPKIVILD